MPEQDVEYDQSIVLSGVQVGMTHVRDRGDRPVYEVYFDGTPISEWHGHPVERDDVRDAADSVIQDGMTAYEMGLGIPEVERRDETVEKAIERVMRDFNPEDGDEALEMVSILNDTANNLQRAGIGTGEITMMFAEV